MLLVMAACDPRPKIDYLGEFNRVCGEAGLNIHATAQNVTEFAYRDSSSIGLCLGCTDYLLRGVYRSIEGFSDVPALRQKGSYLEPLNSIAQETGWYRFWRAKPNDPECAGWERFRKAYPLHRYVGGHPPPQSDGQYPVDLDTVCIAARRIAAPTTRYLYEESQAYRNGVSITEQSVYDTKQHSLMAKNVRASAPRGYRCPDSIRFLNLQEILRPPGKKR